MRDYATIHLDTNRIIDIMINVFSSSAVDQVFEPRSGETKDYTIGMCCFSAKRTSLRIKNTDWSTLNQDNVSERSDMSIRGLLFQ